MRALSEYTLEELQREFTGWGFKASHAAPVLRAHYSQELASPTDGMLLPPSLAKRLREVAAGPGSSLVVRQEAADGTCKLLIQLHDGRTVESVMMPDFRADRAAGCVSSQVGCAMGCDFCATTKTGFERNLTSGEIVEQFLALRREALSAGRRLQTLVFMGMGEPMLNLDAVMAAIRRIGRRHRRPGLATDHGLNRGDRPRDRRFGGIRPEGPPCGLPPCARRRGQGPAASHGTPILRR